jgi:2-(1,2-epoxy-1,2-dihydrophenyl)acetyl-CoA isomerase
LPFPVIARVNGVAAGAGANLAIALRHRGRRQERQVHSVFRRHRPHSRQRRHLGRWPRLVGQARALGLALTGDPLPAEKAAEWGLIWRAVEDDQLDAEVGALAARFAAGPTRGLAAIKRMIRESWSQTLPQELERQRDAMRELGFSDDYREEWRRSWRSASRCLPADELSLPLSLSLSKACLFLIRRTKKDRASTSSA